MQAFWRYFCVGGAAASLDIAIFYLFAQWLGWPYLQVATAGFMMATGVNYLLSIRYVFLSGSRFFRRHEILLVYLVSLAGLGLHLLVLYLAVDGLGVPLMPAKLTATGGVFFWNYLIRRHYVFAQEPVLIPKTGHRCSGFFWFFCFWRD
ncbi:MAG: GtrA family protein [Pseudomonadota bacterium]